MTLAAVGIWAGDERNTPAFRNPKTEKTTRKPAAMRNSFFMGLDVQPVMVLDCRPDVGAFVSGILFDLVHLGIHQETVPEGVQCMEDEALHTVEEAELEKIA